MRTTKGGIKFFKCWGKKIMPMEIMFRNPASINWIIRDWLTKMYHPRNAVCIMGGFLK